ncbi:MAG: hypothetical protein WCP53_12845 [Verrucomicrobiota bacterium]
MSAVEHVTMMLYHENGNHLPTAGAIGYIRSVGMAGTPQTLYGRVIAHRKHVDVWLSRGAVSAPVDQGGDVIRVPHASGPVRWLDAQQAAMDLGNEALRDLAVRLEAGALDTRDVIALAKLGVGAANTRGAMEQKGRALTGIDRLLQLAAGGVDLADDE